MALVTQLDSSGLEHINEGGYGLAAVLRGSADGSH